MLCACSRLEGVDGFDFCFRLRIRLCVSGFFRKAIRRIQSYHFMSCSSIKKFLHAHGLTEFIRQNCSFLFPRCVFARAAPRMHSKRLGMFPRHFSTDLSWNRFEFNKFFESNHSRFYVWYCLVGFFWKQFIWRHGNFVLVALRLRAAAVGALATMETLTLQSGRKISDAATLEYKRAYLVYRAGLNKLASDALQKRVCRYHLRPKNHQLGHIANHFLPKNPRYFANFLSEDFIYKAKVLAEKTHALFMSKQVLERYAIWVCLRWRDWAKEKNQRPMCANGRRFIWRLVILCYFHSFYFTYTSCTRRPHDLFRIFVPRP